MASNFQKVLAQNSRASQPIPIKGAVPPAAEQASSTQRDYDWMTWRMYERITTARYRRAQVSFGQDPLQSKPPQSPPATRAGGAAPERADRRAERVANPPMSEEGFLDGGVFIFDAF